MCFCTYPLLYTPRHPENFDFRAFRSGVSQNRNSWGSSDYQGVAESLNRPDDKAFWGNSRLCVSGRLPHFCMRSFRFPTTVKMQKFAMTRFLTTMSGNARHRSDFSPQQYISVVHFSDTPHMRDQTYIAHGTRPAAAGEHQKGGKQRWFSGTPKEKGWFCGPGASLLEPRLAKPIFVLRSNLRKPIDTKHPCLAEPPPADESPKHKKSNRKFGCFWRCVGDSNP